MAEEIKEMVKQDSESLKEHSIGTQDSDEFVEENQERKEMGAENKEEQEMKPWEQHSAVISIPRFDYNAPSSLLQHSHSGFLITCPLSQLPISYISLFCTLLFSLSVSYSSGVLLWRS